MEEFIKLDTDPYDVIRLFPDLLPQQPNDPDTTPAVKLQDKDLENGILALIDYLRDVRRKIPSSTENPNGSGSASKSALQLQQIIDTTLLKCFLQVRMQDNFFKIAFHLKYRQYYINYFVETNSI